MALVNIRLRHDRSNDWAAATLLQPGELGVETDTGRIKVGDGVRSWSSLPYVDGKLASDTASERPSAVGQTNVGSSSVAARADHSHPLPSTISATSLTTTGGATVGGTLSAATVSATSYSGISIAHVAGLQAALDAKSGDGHSHAVTSLAGFPSTQGQTGRILGWDGTALVWVDGATGGVTAIQEGDGVSVTGTADSGYTIGLDDTVVNRFTVIPSDGTGAVDLSGNVTISAGANVNLSRSGNSVTISATSGASGVAGVASVNNVTGNVTVAASPGSPITVTPSGSTLLLDATVPSAASSAPSALANTASVGLSTDYARADHVHSLPRVDQLAIGNDLDYSGYSVKYSNSFTSAQAPNALSVEGMFAEIDGVPKFSSGSSWITLSQDGHAHSIADVSGLQAELNTIPAAGSYVESVNGVTPDQSGNVNITTSVGSVAWGSVTSAPTNVSYFVNDANYITASQSPVQSVNNQTGQVSITAASLTDFAATTLSSITPGSGIVVTASGDGGARISLEGSGSYNGNPTPNDPVSPPPDGGGDDPLSGTPQTAMSVSISPAWTGTLKEASSRIVASVEGVAGPTFLWQYQDGELNSWNSVDPIADLDANGSVLYVTRNRSLHGWKLRVVAYDSGGESVVSNVVEILVGGVDVLVQPTGPIVQFEDGAADASVSSSLRVTTSSSTTVKHQWQVSRLPTTGDELQFDTGVVRGQLYLNLPGGTKIGSGEVSSFVRFDAIQNAAVGDFVDVSTADGLAYKRMFVRCKIYGDVNNFSGDPNFGSEVVYSDEVEVRIVQPLPNFTAHPQTTNISGGAVSFTAATEFFALHEWQWTKDGDRSTWSTMTGTTSTYASGDQTAYQISKTGLSGEEAGVWVRLRIYNYSGKEKFSEPAQILGPAPLAGAAPSIVGNASFVLAGTNFSLSKAVSHDGPVDVVFQTRSNDSAAWSDFHTETLITGSGEVQTPLIAATQSMDGTQYRVRIASDAGSAHTPALVLAVRQSTVSSGGLEDETVAYNSTINKQVTGTLLSSDVPHYAVVAVERMTKTASGSYTTAGGGYYIRPQNGQGVSGAGAVSYYAAGAFSSYDIGGIAVDGPVRVSILVSTSDPRQFFLNSPQLTTPWSRATNIAFPGATSDRMSFIEETHYVAERNGVVQLVPQSNLSAYDESWSVTQISVDDVVPAGFTVLAQAVYDALSPRPISFNIIRQVGTTTYPVVQFIPEHYHFSGAADQDGRIVVCPKDYWNWHNYSANKTSFYLLSEDEGESFSSLMFTHSGGSTFGSISVRQVLRWNGKFLVLYEDSVGRVRLLMSADGRTWSQSSQIYGKSATASVANGRLIIAWQLPGATWFDYTGSYRHVSWRVQVFHGSSNFSTNVDISFDAQALHPFNGAVASTQMYHPLAEIKYIHGRYVSSCSLVSSDLRNWQTSVKQARSGVLVSYPPNGSDSYATAAPGADSISEVSVVPGLGQFSIRRRREPGHMELVAQGQEDVDGLVLNDMSRTLYNGTDSHPVALGPQVGRFLYGQVTKRLNSGAFLDRVNSDLYLAKIDAYSPGSIRTIAATDGGRLLPGLTYTRGDVIDGTQVTKANYSSTDISDFLRVGGYRYGPTAENDSFFGSLGVDVSSQLATKYLDGTDCPEYSDTIYSRNKVMKFYRSDLRGAPSGGTGVPLDPDPPYAW